MTATVGQVKLVGKFKNIFIRSGSEWFICKATFYGAAELGIPEPIDHLGTVAPRQRVGAWTY